MSVYVGVGSQDYMGHVLANCYHAANPYMITGNMTSVVCGRVSFLFGLEAGPRKLNSFDPWIRMAPGGFKSLTSKG